jgi:glutaconyl-CoA decarboxylase
MPEEIYKGAIASHSVPTPIAVRVARAGQTDHVIWSTIACPDAASPAPGSVATAAVVSAAVQRFLSERAAHTDGGQVRCGAPWAMVGRLDALGMDGFHRVRVEARKRPMQTFKVTIEGHVYQVTVEEVRRAATPPGAVRPAKAAAPAAGVPRGGERLIRAPIPGKVLTVNVGPADSVGTGTVLLVLEAMKMENDLLASVEGTVKTVHVRPGDTVNAGDVVVVIE